MNKELGELAASDETGLIAPVGHPGESAPFQISAIETLHSLVSRQQGVRMLSGSKPSISVTYATPRATDLEEFDLAREVKRNRPTKVRRFPWIPVVAGILTLSALIAAWGSFIAPLQGRRLLPTHQEAIAKLKPLLRNAP
ncbi:MAG: hypothetical protein EON56_02080 [Alphaproteobacteria bacterium]|nr:MAG: hypothetical protein EON56_02080 [Alphaproteobacteria bacterium]